MTLYTPHLRSLLTLCLLVLISLGYGLASASTLTTVTTGRDIILLLDNSGSMHDHDPDHKIHRALRQFIQRLNDTDRVAVILFDDKVSQIAGLTKTNASGQSEILQSLAALNYRGKYTNTAAALEKAIYTLRNQYETPDLTQNNQHKIILLITDGVVDTGNTTRNRENVQWMRNGLADEAARLQIAIYGIAVTEAADFQTLQSLAQKTDASYFRAESSTDVGLVLSQILQATKLQATNKESASLLSPQAETRQTKPAFTTQHSSPSHNEPAPLSPVDQSVATESQAPLAAKQLRSPAASQANRKELASTPPTTAKLKSITPPHNSQPNHLMSSISNSLLIVIILITVLVLALLFFWLAKSRRGSPKSNTRRQSSSRSASPTPTVSSATQSSEAEVVLHDLSGISGQDEINLSGEVIIGRKAINPATSVVIPSNTISRQHAQFVSENGVWSIVDLGSGNGTFVNGRRITARQQLKEGDIIAFDEYKFRFGDAEFTGNETVIRDNDATIAQLPSEEILASHAATTQFTAQVDVSEPSEPAMPANNDSQTDIDSTNLDLDSLLGDEDPTIADFKPAAGVSSEADEDKTVADWSQPSSSPANSPVSSPADRQTDAEEEAFTILPDASPNSNTDVNINTEGEIDLDFDTGEETEQIEYAATTQFNASDIDASVFADEDSTVALYSGAPKPPSTDVNNDDDATIAIASPATGGKPKK